MREIYYGGSFDPFHQGHEAFLRRLLREEATRLIVAPAGEPALKAGNALPFAVCRYSMVLAALKAIFGADLEALETGVLASKSFRVSFKELKAKLGGKAEKKEFTFSDGGRLSLGDIRVKELLLTDEEITRRSASYTVQSLEQRCAAALTAKKKIELCLALGTDFLHTAEQWRELERIASLAEILLIHRKGESLEFEAREAERLKKRYGLRLRFLDADLPEISSRALRAEFRTLRREGEEPGLYPVPRLGEEGLLRYLPEAVRSFIQENGFYLGLDLSQLLPAELLRELMACEKRLWPQLSLFRLRHSVNVLYTALALQQRHGGASLRQTAWAALMHDMAKESDYRRCEDFLAEVKPRELLDYPSLVHGPFGAYLLRRDYHIEDPLILNAVRNHTLLGETPTMLDLLVSFADKTEPARDFADVEALREIGRRDLLKGVLAAHGNLRRSAKARGKRLCPLGETGYRALLRMEKERRADGTAAEDFRSPKKGRAEKKKSGVLREKGTIKEKGAKA